MWIEFGLAAQVDEFWEPAGAAEDLPRDLIGPAQIALPLTIRLLPNCSVHSSEAWLRRHGIATELGRERRLRGCLVAYAGQGFIAVDATDPADERRFTIAHEIAHFLIDYQAPRLRALDTLGTGIIAVLDGLRPPTRTERLHGILSGISLGIYVDLMERSTDGGYARLNTLSAEQRADRLAFELLAPAADAWAAVAALPAASGSHAAFAAAAADFIVTKYGLPRAQAVAYTSWLLRKAGRKPAFRDWLDAE